jgi:hypothetical protein
MRCTTILILLSLAGCGGSADSKLDEVEKHVRSWSATLEMVSAQYTDGAVTRNYVRQILHAADDDLQEQRKTLAKQPDQAKRLELQGRLDGVNEQARSLAALARGSGR